MKTDLTKELDIQQSGSLIHHLKDNEAFTNVLYKEFIETPKKRDFNKYIEKVEHLTSQLKAHQEGKLRNDPIARISFETDYHEQERIFFSKKDSEISESYLTHKLEDTLTYKTIQKIEVVLQNAKKVQAPVEPQCKILINLIDTLDLSIRRTVANEVIKYLDETNEFLFLNILSIKDGSLSLNKAEKEERLHSAESWELSKIEYQNFLIEYLKELPKETQGLRVEPKERFVQKGVEVDFYTFVMSYWANDDKLLSKLKVYLSRKMKGVNPKPAMIVIKAMRELKILDPSYKGQDLFIKMFEEFKCLKSNVTKVYNNNEAAINTNFTLKSSGVYKDVLKEMETAIVELGITEKYLEDHNIELLNDKE